MYQSDLRYNAHGLGTCQCNIRIRAFRLIRINILRFRIDRLVTQHSTGHFVRE